MNSADSLAAIMVLCCADSIHGCLGMAALAVSAQYELRATPFTACHA